MSVKLDTLTQNLRKHLGDKVILHSVALGEISIDVDVAHYFDTMMVLRDERELCFEQLMDLCGVDYSEYGDAPWEGKRFAVVTHLLSISNNCRLRIRCFAPDDNFPSVPSIASVWNSANWFEREAFDLFGIVFPGHEDLRRILTDYGFIGHPFRKDFPVSGYVEMRYDQDQQRLIYQPVSIEPREDIPRIVRESGYGESENA